MSLGGYTMKKLALVQTAAMALLILTATSASAEEPTAPVSEMPIDQGIVIDVSGGEEGTANTGNAQAQTQTPPTDVNALVTEQAEEEAAANDGTVLPLDQGNIDAAEIDSGTGAVEQEGAQPQVTAPEEDTVVLTEKEPVVEPLAQTGIADNAVAYAGLVGVLGAVGLFVARRYKTAQED